MMRTAICLGVASLLATPVFANEISELRIEQSGTDTDEYFELAGTPGGSLDQLTYIVIGDSDVFPPGQNGSIEAVIPLTGFTYDANGFFVVAEKTFTLGTADLVAELNFEGNDNVTHMLVAQFTGSLGDDLDTDDDGVLDITPWSAIVDSIALLKNATPDGNSEEWYYSDNTVGPDNGFVPGQAYRCNDTGEWRIGVFDPIGQTDTPSAANPDCGGGGGDGAVINEYRVDQTSTDTDEFFELLGDPGTSLEDMTYIVIGDGSTGSGTIEAVIPLAGLSINATGYFLAVEATFSLSGTPDLVTTLNFENRDNVTHMLVRNFTGSNADDLDTDDDGVLDVEPWSEVIDCISLVESFTSGEMVYCGDTIGPDGSYQPSHGYRCFPDGTWTIGSFYPSDLIDTPGAENPACPLVQCGGDDPRNCFEERAEAGCSDASCCELVNAVDASCGETAWDANCVALAVQLCHSTNAAPEVTLSEVRMKQGGADNDEFFEIAGAAGTSLDGVCLVVIGGMGTDLNGEIETAVNLSGHTIPASGYFVVAEDTFTLGSADVVMDLDFNDAYNKTLILVHNFAGTVNGDLDTDDDCVLDSNPWDTQIDGVNWISGMDSNCTYATASAGPDEDFSPGHAYVCDVANGTWGVGTFNADDTDALDSPGVANPADCDPAACPEYLAHSLIYPCTYILDHLRPTCCDTWDSGCQQIVDRYCNFGASAPATVFLREMRIDQIGDDNDEYVEIEGDPGTSLDGYAIVVIGDGTGGSGVAETFAPLIGATTDENGLVVLADASTYTLGTPDASWSFDLENSDNITVLLVYGYSATEADADLDLDDDGFLDIEPWIEVLDCISLIETPDEGDQVYCTSQIGPDDTYVPGHIFYDCDLGSWQIGVFDPVGETDTPGVLNNGCGGGSSCPADFTGDGVVNGADLTVLLGDWGGTIADLTGDGIVNGADLTVLLGSWGPC